MRFLFSILLIGIMNIGFSQINKAEYFIDTDPGTDNGTDITLSSTNSFSINESFTINTGSLNEGIHTLYIRTRDVNDVWSLYYKTTFLVHDFSNANTPSQIVAAEYFFDTDPGTDNGTDIPISTPGFSVSESLAIPAAMSDGIHTLYVRTRDADGVWSLYFKQTFLIHSFTNPSQTAINQYEYFIDTDPGTGASGNTTAVDPATFNLNEGIAISTGPLAEGTYYLHIRVRDENMVWSHYEVAEFTVTEALGVEDNLLLLTKVYPIPAKDQITIDSEVPNIESIKLYNMQGKRITDFEGDTNAKNYDVSPYAKGAYILQIKSLEGTLNKKIIIE